MNPSWALVLTSVNEETAKLAIIGNQTYTLRPQRWAVLTEECKTILEGRAGANLRTSGLLTSQGYRFAFRVDPDRWTLC
jgi:hypothetical protein